MVVNSTRPRMVSSTGKMSVSLSPFAPENLVSRDEFGRHVSRQPAHVSRQPALPDFRGGVHLFKPPYVIGSVPSLSGHAIAYRWRSLSRVRRHRATCPEGSSSNGCCLCITMDQLICASFPPHPLLWHGVVIDYSMLKATTVPLLLLLVVLKVVPVTGAAFASPWTN